MGTLNPNPRPEAQAFSASSSKGYKGKRHGRGVAIARKKTTLKTSAGFFIPTCNQINEEIVRETNRKRGRREDT
jgi:hypothetical protein